MIFNFLEIFTSSSVFLTRNQLHKNNPTSTFYSLNNSDQDALSKERVRQFFVHDIYLSPDFHKLFRFFSRNTLHRNKPTSTLYSLNNSDQGAMSIERVRQSFVDDI